MESPRVGRAGMGVWGRCASAPIGETIGCSRSLGEASCLVVTSAVQLAQPFMVDLGAIAAHWSTFGVGIAPSSGGQSNSRRL